MTSDLHKVRKSSFTRNHLLVTPLVVLCVFGLAVSSTMALPLMGAKEEKEEDPLLPPKRKLTKAEQQNFTIAYENGMTYLKQQNFDMARVCFQQCITLDPRDYRSHLRLAACYGAAKQKEQAIMELFTTLRCNTDCMEARFDLGTMLMGDEKWDEAGALFLQVLQKYPENLEARGNLAVCLQQECEVESAIAQYKYILDKAPNNIDANFNLAAGYETKKMWDDAAQHYKKVVQLNPKHSMAFAGLGRCLFAKGDNNSAIVLFKHALDLHSKNYYAYLGLGEVYEKLGQRKQAIESYTKAVSINPKDYTSQKLLKKMLESAGSGRELAGNSLRATP